MVIWQDIVVSIANFVFLFSIVNQVIYGFKTKKALIAKGTSIPTFIGLYTMAVAFFTIELILTSIMTFITATLWLMLFIQALLYEEVKR